MSRADGAAPALRLAEVRARSGPFRLGPVDVEVVEGAILGVLGPSGAGKSTLLDVVAGFVGVEAGTVEIAGEEVAAVGRSVAPERRGVALLSQEVGLFGHADARTNVAAAARDPEAAAANLERVGFRGDPGVPVDRLSGGERKRVALARALAAPRSLLLLDEPGAHLDVSARRSVAAAVAETLRAEGRAGVVAAHDLGDLLDHAPDALLLLADGAVLAAGPTDGLMRAPGTRAVAERLGFEGFLDATREEGGVRCALGRLPWDGVWPSGSLAVAWRPDGVRAVPLPGGSGEAGEATGVVRALAWGAAGLGADVEIGGERLRAAAVPSLRVGDRIRLEWTAPTVVSRE